MKTKKIFSLSAAAAVAFASVFSPGCVQGRDVTVTLNGEILSFPQPPVVMDGTTLVPMRVIFETLGMDVSWNGGDNSVTAVKNGKSVFVTVGSTSARINGQTVELAQAPIIENGTTLVPLRVISEAMGVNVSWDQDSYTVAMTKTDSPSDDSWKAVTGSIDLTAMTVSGPGLSIDGKTVLVTGGGDFTVTGENADAMIRVNTDSRIKLRLSGVRLTNTDGPAIFFENCDKGFITVSKNTENYLSDGADYTVDAKGTVFSNDDLEIQGGGSLTVVSNYNHAIVSDDKLTVEEGVLNLTAVGDGLHANDGIEISGGSINITATGDGIQSEDYVDITGGALNIITNGEVQDSAGGWGGMGGMGGRGNRNPMNQVQQGGRFQPQDGQQPPQGGQLQPQDGQQPPQGGQLQPQDEQQPPQGGQLQPQDGQQPPQGGRFQPIDGGAPGEMTGVIATETEEENPASTKGIKARTNLLIRGGAVTVDSADHCLHSEDVIYICGGELNLTSQKGKGASAHQNLSVDGGVINVLKSTEGLESKGSFAVNGGSIHVTASDDGLNAGGTNGRDAGQNGGHDLYLNGGYVYVDAAGDGLDANGIMHILGGTYIVNGPTNSGNGALDSGGGIVSGGGTLIASGSAGMAEYPRGESSQLTVVYGLSQTQAAGELLRIVDSSGSEVLAYRTSKPYQNIVFSSSLLRQGEEYSVYLGGEYSGGSDTDGWLQGGTASGGTLAGTVTLDGLTTVGGFANGGGFGGFGGGFGRGQRW